MVDDIGKFYDHLPDEFRKATIDDFHVQGKKRIGLVYIVEWNDEIRFSFQRVTPFLRASNLLPFIESGKVFVLKS